MTQEILNEQVPLSELDARRNRFLDALNARIPEWETVLLVNHVNQLYFTGTMQDGVVVFQKDGSRRLFVRRSLERALDESALPSDEILPMSSYKQVAAVVGENVGVTCVEKDVLPISTLERMQRNLKMTSILSVEPITARLRAVKSPWEMQWLELAGRLHHHFLTDVLPTLLQEGMTECEFVAEVYASAVKLGYQGITRFAMFQNEVAVGQYGFGESTLYPTSFDGPSGSRGMSAAVPFVGSRTLRLEGGQSVFADMGFGVNGYHTDKTQVYFFRGSRSDAEIPEEALMAHARCREIQRVIAERLRPGEIPERIYQEVMEGLEPEFLKNFQGFGTRQVKFLGHGIGLQVDEFPVLARGFSEPLEENMLFAVEPKKGIAGFGTVGVEDTFVVTADGGRCLTGGAREIMVI
ncbi:MAG: M24 family metallopeptidase [Planctomycetia bacterium]|nr:M24 family metallopeptidase [Planctomycetia bacterium]